MDWIEKIFLLAILFLIAAPFIFYAVWEATDEEPFERYKERNELYRCRNDGCKRMFRQYQRELTQAVKLKDICPHCSRTFSDTTRTGVYIEKVKTEDKWMKSHIDCPAISKREYHKIRQAIKTAEQLRKDEAAMKRFEEYNQFSVDVSWIKNLQKKERGNG